MALLFQLFHWLFSTIWGLFAGLIFLIGTLFWIWMLVDCLLNEPANGNDKLIWVLVIICTMWIGAAIYLVIRRPERIRTLGK